MTARGKRQAPEYAKVRHPSVKIFWKTRKHTPMESPSVHHQRLETWKEIAAYLGRGIRTVQRWEREMGLPVYREAGGKSERVFSWTDELDAWQRGEPHTRQVAGIPSPTDPHPSPPGRLGISVRSWAARTLARHKWVLAGLLVLGLLLPSLWLRPARPAIPDLGYFRITTLGDDRQVQVFDTIDRLQLTLFFRNFPVERKMDRYRRLLTIVDLDMDGRKDVLFYNPNQRHLQLCLRQSDGSFQAETWPLDQLFGLPEWDRPHISVGNVLVEDLTGDGRPEITVIQSHDSTGLACCRIFDNRRRVILTLWHPGGLHHALYVDRDHDGRKELYLAGTNPHLPGPGAPVLIALAADWTRPGQEIGLVREDRRLPARTPAGTAVAYIRLGTGTGSPDGPIPEGAVLWSHQDSTAGFRLTVRVGPWPTERETAAPNHHGDGWREYHFDAGLQSTPSLWRGEPALVNSPGSSGPAPRTMPPPVYWNGTEWQTDPCAIPQAG